ncbi:MAG: hypothetical protein KVP17_004961 [Porospora cf. gigantea B]|uniref:uncharacterized protein n=1 Tax=Porospora cf. gigantea B TaxID=2853592 RepID=UPI003571F705|nr:MAG: hypothetical protein KVP17_004961 [Porospora cf. gigantea B]
MCVVISDGRFNKDRVRPFIQRAVQMRMLPLMVCLDSGSSARQSIQKITSVRKINGKMVTANYLDDFPFPTYCVVDDPSKLTSVVSNIVRQFVQMTTQAD